MPRRTSLLPGACALLVCGLALAPHLVTAQGTESGNEPGGLPRVEGTAGPPPAAGPPASPTLSGDRPAGRTEPGRVEQSPVTPVVTGPPPSLGDPREVSETAGTPAAVERAAPSAAGEPGRQADGTVQTAAGLPGRQDPPPTAAPASSSGQRQLSEREREVAEVFGCPRDKVAVMLAAAVGEAEFSASLGLEREIIRYCRDRWAEVSEILKSEFDLAAVLRKDNVARERAAIALEERRRVARARIEGARLGAAEAAKAVEERKLLAIAAPAPAEEPETVEPQPEPEPEPVVVMETPEPETQEVYGWFSIIGRAGNLRAGVTDGEGKWWVREGEELPDGALITEISARPLRVVFEDGPTAGLPYRRLR